MDINKELAYHYGVLGRYWGMLIECVDGFKLLIAAGPTHTSVPESSTGPWYAIQVEAVSAVPEFIMQYARDPDNPFYTSYDQVPVHLVEDLVNRHGGPISELGRDSNLVKPEIWKKRRVSEW